MSPVTKAEELNNRWETDARWKGVARPYSAEQVLRLRSSLPVEYTLARHGAERLWSETRAGNLIRALGAVTGNQAVQQVQAGLRGIYVSGWQVAADNNSSVQTYPDQGLYPVDSAPNLVRRIQNALRRADQVQRLGGDDEVDYFVPIVADGEAGFGGTLNTYELIQSMIEAGAAGVHLEDQLSSLKKCGHMGGKVLVPMRGFIAKMVAARLAADVLDVPTVLIARTDALSGNLLRSDIDERDQPFITGKRTVEGYFEVRAGLDYAVARSVAFAPYADLLWFETSTPDIDEAREFARRVHEQAPGKLLAYNCSPSFNWRAHLAPDAIARFQDALSEVGFKFQFVTLAGFHSLNLGMFELARAYANEGMAAYSRLQDREFALERDAGYAAVKHQRFVGAGYFDEVQLALSGGEASTTALTGSTEEAQFHDTNEAREGISHG